MLEERKMGDYYPNYLEEDSRKDGDMFKESAGEPDFRSGSGEMLGPLPGRMFSNPLAVSPREFDDLNEIVGE